MCIYDIFYDYLHISFWKIIFFSNIFNKRKSCNSSNTCNSLTIFILYMRNISIFCISWFVVRIRLTFGVRVCGYGKLSQKEDVKSSIFDIVCSFCNRYSWSIPLLLGFGNKRSILLNGLEIRFRIRVFIKVCIHALKGEIFIRRRHFYHSNLKINKNFTFANIKVMAGNTVESNSPYGFDPTMITRHVFMPDVFINLVGYLEEFLFLVFLDTFVT